MPPGMLLGWTRILLFLFPPGCWFWPPQIYKKQRATPPQSDQPGPTSHCPFPKHRLHGNRTNSSSGLAGSAQCSPWTELQRVAVAMAFFGLTLLGYQEPFRAWRRELAADRKEPAGAGPFLPKLLPLRPGGTVHQGREDVCGQPTRRVRRATPPNQVYRVPLTCGQDLGWWLPRDPALRPEEMMPWMVVPRRPLVWSPVTRFVDSMSLSNPHFSLF